MSMGAHPSSRVAQRFANELMAPLLQRFDESDAPSLASEPAPLQGVMKERALFMHDEFGTHTRLADAAQYTDDSLAAAVGIERAVRLLRCFFDIVGSHGMRLMLVKWHKMNAGAHVTWLGAQIACPIGCASCGIRQQRNFMSRRSFGRPQMVR